jgi:thiol-disulfide isomerase/thioredoxin
LEIRYGGFVKRLAIVVCTVVVAAMLYRSFGSAETGTGSLTLPQPAPNVGDNAPEFTARSVEGRSFELSDHGVYVITFWSTLNKSSNQAVPGFEDLAREYGHDGVSFAAVYVNSAPSEDDVPYTMLLDSTGELVSKYNVKRVPRLFVVNDGTVEYALDYYYDGYEQGIKEALDETLTKEKDRQSALREES